jgi:hypothetical protein
MACDKAILLLIQAGRRHTGLAAPFLAAALQIATEFHAIGPSTPLRFAQDFGWRLGRRQIASSSVRKWASLQSLFGTQG